MSLIEQDIILIKEKLKELCIGTVKLPVCISRVKIYESLKDQLNCDIDEYNFCQTLSELISNKTIKGYEIRKGRTGGVHKEGLYSDHDIRRQKKIKERNDKKNQKTIQLKIDNNCYTAKITIGDAMKFLTNVLDAETDADGNVFVNDMRFKTKYPEVFKNFITNWLF